MEEVQLKSGREGALLRRHPWVYSGAVVPSPLENGQLVRIVSAKGNFLAYGFAAPKSQILLRAWSFDESAIPDAQFLKDRIAKAWRQRKGMFGDATNAVRVVNAENDGLPGLIIDRYADVISVQLQSCGAEHFRDVVGSILLELFLDVNGVYDRSDSVVREREGLPAVSGSVLATRGGVPAIDFSNVEIRENGLRYTVDVVRGQKTGTYLDQIRNHALVGGLAKGRDVLDAFCCDGGFALECLRGGAKSVLAIDSSAVALERLKHNLERNDLADGRTQTECADVFVALRKMRDSRKSFDLIILDPPKFADSKNHIIKACRAYKDANLLALKLLRPGGLLATFSCSGAITTELLQKVVAEAAVDAACDARVIGSFTQAPDHPVSLAYPEGHYLKGLLVSV